MKLSKRLELLAYLVEKHKKGNILADIGTDHAYLPCYLIEKNIIDKASKKFNPKYKDNKIVTLSQHIYIR